MIEKTGQYFIRLDILSFEQAEKILKVQKSRPGRKFGEIAFELGYISAEDLDDYLKD